MSRPENANKTDFIAFKAHADRRHLLTAIATRRGLMRGKRPNLSAVIEEAVDAYIQEHLPGALDEAA